MKRWDALEVLRGITIIVMLLFGENPLLAYITGAPVSLRAGGQAWFEAFLEPRVASFAFGLCGILFILAILIVCHRRRWILKL